MDTLPDPGLAIIASILALLAARQLSNRRHVVWIWSGRDGSALLGLAGSVHPRSTDRGAALRSTSRARPHDLRLLTHKVDCLGLPKV